MQAFLDFSSTTTRSDDRFHPAVEAWFERRFGQPTEIQQRAWAVTRRGQSALIAAPTGSGKTLAAFLSAINDLVVRGLDRGLDDAVQVLYVSPLKALSNDIQKNLQEPLLGIRATLAQLGYPDVAIRDGLRTGDTPPAERERLRRTPPHLLVTTPESLYLLLSSERGRQMLGGLRTVIVDELHAVAHAKRGAHLMLSLERLDALCAVPPVRIGLSATVRPLAQMADYLAGARERARPVLVDVGHQRTRDLELVLPAAPLSAVMANEVWGELYSQLSTLALAHRTTLVFVNQRRTAERVARHLGERLGEAQVAAHHGSLSREHRLRAEQRLKSGQLRVLVATSSLELGIDIGDVDLVCQLGSPRAINAFLQRVGRAGHAVGAIPKGRLFPLALDDLLECTALLHAVERGELDRIRVPEQPLDVLAQQIVAEVAMREWSADALFAQLRRAWPYHALSRDRFDAVLRMLADGYSTRRGRRGAYLHWDEVNGLLRARRGARLTAVTNGGVIPDQFDVDVLLQPEGLRIGSVGEDFAFESIPGDIFQLGANSYRILKSETGKLLVEDAHGLPPSVPFWFGEGLGRSDELSAAVRSLLDDVQQALTDGVASAEALLRQRYRLAAAAASQLAEHLGAAWLALGALPGEQRVIFERFFDDVGDAHLVIHSPFGVRINRAWGLALRKRFCRQFNFELQASALDDSIILSLGPTHSFPLDEPSRYLRPAQVRDILTQALLDAPMFPTRWRWVASAALAVRRMNGSRRVPPQFQRSDAEDLLTVVFPDQVACLENIQGPRQIPDHPLVAQTISDCLTDTMDIAGLQALLQRLESGAVQLICCDLNAPSALAQAIIHAKPYAFLDDGEAEERRTRSISSPPLGELGDAARLSRPDPDAIARVRAECRIDARNADELHDALLSHGWLRASELPAGGADAWLDSLSSQRRVCRLDAGDDARWVAVERLHEARALWPDAQAQPALQALRPQAVEPADALRELLRARLELLGPVSAAELTADCQLPPAQIDAALLALEAEGGVLRGAFSATDTLQWCDRRLLARIHRYSRDSRRSAVRAAPPAQFMRFLCRWQGLWHGAQPPSGEAALLTALQRLDGFAAAAAVWEDELLPARIADYRPEWLDRLCSSGRLAWARPPLAATGDAQRRAGPIRSTPIRFCARDALAHWQRSADTDAVTPSSRAQLVLDQLRADGASFADELASGTGLLPSELEDALGELVALGLLSCDRFTGLRRLVMPADRRERLRKRFGRDAVSLDDAGRWSLARRRPTAMPEHGLADPATETIARALLARYGVVFRMLLEREDDLPPWRELHYVYRRLEARGEVLGGRFVSGFAGEQFALADAARTLAQLAATPEPAERVVVSACDPLNLVGILIPGDRLPRLPGNRLLLHNGAALAVLSGGEPRWLGAETPADDDWATQLIRSPQLRGKPGPASSLRRPTLPS